MTNLDRATQLIREIMIENDCDMLAMNLACRLTYERVGQRVALSAMSGLIEAGELDFAEGGHVVRLLKKD